MSFGWRGLGLSLASGAIVLAVVLRDTKRTSPGPLALVHARETKLGASDGCKACHGGWTQSMAQACNACHKDIDEQIASARGLHGALSAANKEQCARCHADHLGSDFALVSDASFALAGFASREAFDHSHTTFGLTGRHAGLQCVECHAAADLDPLPAGTPRFLGASQGCPSCHEDPHAGRFARGCDTCHGQDGPFDGLPNFVHTSAFPLSGAHAVERCTDCHEPESAFAIESVAGVAPPAPRACADCHADSPHMEPLLAAVAQADATTRDASCAACHSAESEDFAHADRQRTLELHAATGFALEPPHAELKCSACHAPEGSFEQRYPGRQGQQCQACHVDPHEGQFNGRGSTSDGCVDCHRATDFTPPEFDLASHARSAFPLEGAHAAVACAVCHPRANETGPRRFVGTPTACADCHTDAHSGAFAGDARSRGGTRCDACHTSASFAPAAASAFDHARDAGFTLDGAHADLSCVDCHARLAAPDAMGRASARAKGTRCVDCHQDVHAPAFAARECSTCHATSDFRRVEPSFDHGSSTGFALQGAHERAECRSCHGEYADPSSSGRHLGRVRELTDGSFERCETCHADPHRGVFDTPGRPIQTGSARGCARCHDQETFLGASENFDHGLWTGFKLIGAHARAACTDCHAALEATSRAATRLGPAKGTSCADCHTDPHAGQFARQGANDCARCHADGEDFLALRFDHARDSRFALDKTHGKLDCAACHRLWPLADGRSVVRYKPLGVECLDCHARPPQEPR